MEDSPAARLAEMLRAAMKDQALNGAELAQEIERLTGELPSPNWVSRRIGGAARSKPLITVDDDLYAIAAVLGVDLPTLAQMVVDAIFAAAPRSPKFASPTFTPPVSSEGNQ